MRIPSDLRRPALLLTTVFLACGGADDDGPPAGELPGPDDAAVEAQIVVAGVGFSTPESVLHDPMADVYLVSNIAGSPLEADGNGFISRIAPDGSVLDLKWIDGEDEGTTLSAPKGMALDGDLLYVTDIDCIRTFDRATGEPRGETCMEGVDFLNDLVRHPSGGVVFTDLGFDASFAPAGSDAVYRLWDGEVTTLIADPAMGAPNGVAILDGEVLVVTYGSGDVFTVDATGARTDVARFDGAQFDGVEVLADGRVLMSDWTSSCVQALAADGSLTCLVADVDAPADIGLDGARNRVLIPLFNANEVRIVPIG